MLVFFFCFFLFFIYFLFFSIVTSLFVVGESLCCHRNTNFNFIGGGFVQLVCYVS